MTALLTNPKILPFLKEMCVSFQQLSVDAGSEEDLSCTEVFPFSLYLVSLCTTVVATPQIIE